MRLFGRSLVGIFKCYTRVNLFLVISSALAAISTNQKSWRKNAMTISKCYIPVILFLIGSNVSAATCFNPKTECLEGSAARNIEGIPVTLDCWHYRSTYECKENSDNNCQLLRDQRCSQIGADCKTKWGSICAVQNETYSCPVEQCSDVTGIVCGKDLFCVGSDCSITNLPKSNKYDGTITNLAILDPVQNQGVNEESNKYTGCENIKLPDCKTTYVKKNCNEEVHPIQRVCDKVPNVSTHINGMVYPDCQNLIITQHINTYCPSGYGEVFYSDMVTTQGDHWDDIRFCTKMLPPGEGSECYSGGYHISSNNGCFGSGQAIVPKGARARIKFTNVYFGSMTASIINDTTGQTLYSNGSFANGQIIELPYSDTQDQKFRFYASECGTKPGIMVLYIDHAYKEKGADVTWPEEGDCRDI